ncbi:hypothetical protein BJ875DRAFT_24797 [Amylocarpus encephaloides]|uniref:Peptidase A1 domain-containing protein n=1 Tax=Amylocarpus encephaloides TaxID=45428 RepID=A0A9P7YS01_9HELO|nr:hypothetical protein BJ875DRAFT_24797 [Amylocarpus encephaloides]
MAVIKSLVLILCVVTSTLATPLEFRATTTAPFVSESSPNPIGKLYPGNITGTLNGTIAVVPIPYKLARKIIPSQWGILTKAYQQLLPGFPKDSYPLIVKSLLDHDVGLNGTQLIPDFQTVRVNFPFVDILNDGYSSFQWGKYLLITESNEIGIDAIREYGSIPVPSLFKPDFQAYKYARPRSKTIYAEARANTSACADATTKFSPFNRHGAWPLSFYINATNQPVFGDPAKGCDNQILFYNTTLTTGKNAPVHVRGDIFIKAPYAHVPNDRTFRNVFGIKVDVAFLENNYYECETLKGYHGTGSGDGYVA